jgi:ATP-binding protein involved in chromosome partitioning
MPFDTKTALDALRTVQDPELHRDLVSLNMIKDLAVDGTAVSLKVELTTPACPLKDTIGKDVERALKAAGASRVTIAWGAQVRSMPGVGQGGLTPGVKNIILVGAGKGGVGKSTVSINLAVALAKMGAKVGILDADIYGPSVPILTGLTERPTSADGQRLEPLHAHGLKVMSIGFLIDPDQALIWRGPMVTGALLQLLKDVNWGELDYLVLDLPPGTGDIPLTLAQNVKAAGVVLVSTPQDVACTSRCWGWSRTCRPSSARTAAPRPPSSTRAAPRRPPRRWGSGSWATCPSTSPSAWAATRACPSAPAPPTPTRPGPSSRWRATWPARSAPRP